MKFKRRAKILFNWLDCHRGISEPEKDYILEHFTEQFQAAKLDFLDKPDHLEISYKERATAMAIYTTGGIYDGKVVTYLMKHLQDVALAATDKCNRATKDKCMEKTINEPISSNPVIPIESQQCGKNLPTEERTITPNERAKKFIKNLTKFDEPTAHTILRLTQQIQAAENVAKKTMIEKYEKALRNSMQYIESLL